MAAFVFKCPTIHLSIQHRLDDGENVPENEYEVVKCAACIRLHSSIGKQVTCEPKIE